MSWWNHSAAVRAEGEALARRGASDLSVAAARCLLVAGTHRRERTCVKVGGEERACEFRSERQDAQQGVVAQECVPTAAAATRVELTGAELAERDAAFARYEELMRQVDADLAPCYALEAPPASAFKGCTKLWEDDAGLAPDAVLAALTERALARLASFAIVGVTEDMAGFEQQLCTRAGVCTPPELAQKVRAADA